MEKSKKKNIINNIIKIIVYILVIITSLIAFSFVNKTTVKADSMQKIITLGADLSKEEKDLMLKYFNPSSDVEIIYINNQEEKSYLNGIISEQTIGNRTYSCCYLELTDEGGVNVQTLNLTYITADMIKNSLITRGITNANVIAACPKKVSGTGALTGVFKAYETLKPEEVDSNKSALAAEELVITMDLDKEIPEDKDITASEIIGELKEEVIQINPETTEEVENIVDNYLNKNSLNISSDTREDLIKILDEINDLGYKIDEIKSAYTGLKEKLNSLNNTKKEVKETANETKGLFDYIKSIFIKEDKVESKEEITGILANTNEEVFEDEEIVITASDESILESIDTKKIKEAAENSIDEAKTIVKESSIIDNIINFFKGLFSEK